MAHTFNWNPSTRVIDAPRGPQNPCLIYCFDSGITCWTIRLKPGQTISRIGLMFAIAVFKIKYDIPRI